MCLVNEKPCGEDNLYRIIGIFNNIKSSENSAGESRIKVIKNESIGLLKWNQVNDNTWSTSTLASYLNNEYYNLLNSNTKELIDNAVWNISKLDFINNTYTYYTNERLNSNDSSNIWIGKIGLYLPSDYGFATGGTNRSSCLNKVLYVSSRAEFDGYYIETDECINNNWLYNGNETWFISPGTAATRVMFLYPGGYIDFGGQHGTPNVDLNVYPSFFLKSKVNILENKANGSKDNPYILEIDNE